MAKFTSQLWLLLQVLLVTLSATVLLWPATRNGPLRIAVIGLFFIVFGIDLVMSCKSGALKMTPGQIFQGIQSGKLKRSNPLFLMAAVLGTVAMLMVS